MIRRSGFAFVFLFVLSVVAFFLNQAFAAQPSSRPKAPHVEDEVIVRFHAGTDEYSKVLTHYGIGSKRAKVFKIVEGLERIKLPAGLSVTEAIDLYRRNPDVLYAEPNYIVHTTATPNDPSFGSLWGLNNTGQSGGTPDADIDAPEGWNITKGSSNVVIAILDTGIDYNHQDLSANMFRNQADCNANGIDDDGNGYIDDCYGIDTANDDGNPMDDHNHGTHVAGTVGAVGNNNLGVVGVNWNVKLMACKFIAANGSGTTADAITCLEYVKAMKESGVNIVATSNSWGDTIPLGQALADAIDDQRESGILFITAAGNGNFLGIGQNNDTTDFYPCNYFLPNIICVAATDRNDAKASFSNYGSRTVHIGAPGSEILSTTRGNTYQTQSGTSMATPHVSGVAALLKAQDSNRDWKAIKNLILAGGDNKTSMANTITGKRLNANGAMTCSNSVVYSRLRPIGNTINAAVGTPIDLAALNINCANPNGNVLVIIDPGNQIVTLVDDGLGPDEAAADGIYSAQWNPSSTGTFSLTFPGGDVVTVNVANPLISVTPSSLAFGTVNVGSSLNKSFTVKNVGSGTLTGNASTNSPYAIVSGGSYNLGAGQSQTVTVRFSPTSAGTFLGNVSFTGGGGTSAQVSGTGVIPANLSLSFVGKLRDRVGRGDKALSADGSLDATFTMTVQAGSGNRTVTGLTLKRSSYVWNTLPDGYWALGVAPTTSLDAPLLNSSTATVNFAVSDGDSFYLFASDSSTSTSYFPPGSTFTLTATFSDGSTATVNTTLPTPPSANISLTFNGKLRDRVGRGDKALSADGSLDATFTMTVQAGSGNRTVTGLTLKRSSYVWNTLPDGYWALGVAPTTSLDAPLLNSSTATVNFAVSDGDSFYLFASDSSTSTSYFPPGSTFTLTVAFSDGSTATANTTLPTVLSTSISSSSDGKLGER